MRTHTISAAEFKAKCLDIMDQVAATHEPVIVKRRGKPVAKVVPVESEPKSIFGRYKGMFKSHGDLTEPVFSTEASAARTN